MIPYTEQRQKNEAIRGIYADECLSCGVCCVVYNTADKWAIATPALHSIPKKLIQIGPRNSRGDNQYLRTVTLQDKKFSGGQTFQKCVALEGTVRVAARCDIYGTRPPCCVYFDPGSLACLASREWASMAHPEDMFCLGRS